MPLQVTRLVQAAFVWFMFALVAPLNALATDITGSSEQGLPGASVSVPVHFDADGAVVALQLDIGFDPAVVSLNAVSDGDALVDHDLDWEVLSPGQLRLVVTTPTPELLVDGALAQLSFSISGGAMPGTTPLIFSGVVQADGSGNSVNVTTLTDGSITVLAMSGPDGEAVPVPLLSTIGIVILVMMVALMAWVFHRRGIAGVTLSVMLGTVLFSSTIVRAMPLPGDANDDGEVNRNDLPVIVAQILERAQAPGDPDCNMDGEVDVLDTVCIQQPEENEPPVLAAIPDQQTLVDMAFSLSALASDPDLPADTLTYSLDTAPAGMMIDPVAGSISWTPGNAALGDNTVVVRVVDAAGAFDTEGFQLTVVEPTQGGTAPNLIPPGDRVLEVGATMQLSLFATDPDPGDVLRFSLDSAPAGVTVDPVSGVLNWTPSLGDLGDNPVTVTVTDTASLSDSESFTIEVIQAATPAQDNSPPTLVVPDDQSLVFDKTMNVSASANDADPGATLVFDLVNAPAGLSIDANTGAMSWTPAEAFVGSHDVTVRVTDDRNAAALGSFIVTVLDMNRAPVATDDVYEARFGERLFVPAAGVLDNDTDPNGDSLNALLETGPSAGELDLATDGGFSYLIQPTEAPTAVSLQLQCQASRTQGDSRFQTNATIAVGDVDNDGDIELVGPGHIDGSTAAAEIWILNASDCSEQSFINLEAAGAASFQSHPGLVDIDGDGDLEIIVTRLRTPSPNQVFDGQHLIALHHDGSLAWSGDGGSETSTVLDQLSSQTDFDKAGPTFADIDADGFDEIIVGFSTGTNANVFSGLVVYNAVNGTVKWDFLSTVRAGAGGVLRMPTVVDLDMDGTLEIIIHSEVLDHEGNVEFTLPTAVSQGTSTPGVLMTAVANFDDDAFPEIIARDTRNYYLLNHDGSLVWQIEQRNLSRSQLTVADFDGDGEPEFAQVSCGPVSGSSCGNHFLEVFDTDGTSLWSHQGDSNLELRNLYAGAENITAFDANRDGAFDLVFQNIDPNVDRLFIVNGRDGSVLESVAVESYWASGVQQAFVTVADVDGDNEAELITSFTTGGTGDTQIWGSSQDSTLPFAPSFRNQWLFQESYASRDGKTAAKTPIPHWHRTGLNGWNLITPEPAGRQSRVSLTKQCEASIADATGFQDNATIAVGDIDNDGDVELVGTGVVSGFTFMADFWILNADDCSVQRSIDLDQHGGLEWETHVGLLDIDGDGDLELIATRTRFPLPDGRFDSRHLIAVHHDGTLAWPGDGGTETSPLAESQSSFSWRYSGPTFADLDADGTAEIIMGVVLGGGYQQFPGLVVFNAEDGSLAWEFQTDQRAPVSRNDRVPVVADLDLDGTMEVIVNQSVVDHEGQLEFSLPSAVPIGTSSPNALHAAVANFDEDIYPEIIARDRWNHYMFEHDGSIKWQIERRSTADSYITVADFNGDGDAEYAQVGCAGPAGGDCRAYALEVYDREGSRIWTHEGISALEVLRSRESRENITAFDANRDGALDLVYLNETPMRRTLNGRIMIVNGRDGSILESIDVGIYWSSRQSFVAVADVDGDNHAELVTSHTGGIEGATQVWGGTADNPLPHAEPYRNQWGFQEAYASEDGKTMAINPVPHWLQPGRNGWNMITPEPDPLIGTQQTFTYRANDGELNSNIATVTLDVLPPGNPPRFISLPDTLASVGISYEYLVRVVDPDLGDTVSVSLTQAPPGMSYNSATGVLSWLPDTVGEFAVSLLATDTIGFAEAQSFTLQVGEALEVPDVVGLTETAAIDTLGSANLIAGRVRSATHPTIPAGAVSAQTPIAGSVIEFGGAVDLLVSLGPAPEDVDDDNDGFIENDGDCNDADSTVFPGASDVEGDGIDQDCDGIDGSQPVETLIVEPGSLVLLEGERAVLSAFARFSDGSTQNVKGTTSWTSSDPGVAAIDAAGTVQAVSAGTTTLTGTLNGLSGEAFLTVVASDDLDDVAPAALITSPQEDATVTAVTEILGTADDENFVRYRLELAPADTLEFALIAESTTPVSAALLGTLDPAQFLNDLYVLRLTVIDAGGNETTDEVTLQFDGNLSAGQFSLSFVDASMPASGFPLEIIRSYDSRNRAKGDFGRGWTLGLRGARITCSNPLGEPWDVNRSGLSFLLSQSEVTACSVHIPGELAERFDFIPSARVSPIVPFTTLSGRFAPRQGTLGTLVNLDGNNLIVLGAQPGPVKLLNDGDLSDFAPNRFRYTRGDGTELVFVNGELQSITDLSGNTVTISEAGLSHSNGRSYQFERDDEGRVSRIVDPTGAAQVYRYSAAGDLVSHTDALGHITRYRYNQRHGLLSIEDPLNRPVLRNEFDLQGRLLRTEEPDGRVITYSYSGDQTRQTITDEAGSVTFINTDERGNIIEQIDPRGGQILQSFDLRGNLLSRTDANGHRTDYTYDERGNRLSETNALGETTSFAYDAMDRLVSKTDARGNRTSYAYSSDGLLLGKTNALGVQEFSLSYNPRGDLLARTDGLGNTEQFSYSNEGDPVSVTDARGNTAYYSYDAAGTLVSRTDKRGNETRFARDAAGNIVSQIDPDGAVTRYEYDAAGQLVVIVDPTGARTEQSYDSAGNLVTQVDPLGEILSREFDRQGNVVRERKAGILESEFTYDELGRQTSVRTPGGQRVAIDHDPAGNVVRQTNALGHAVDISYDDENRPQRMTAPDGSWVQRVYDESGNTTSQIDALGRVTRYRYDRLNRLIETVYPDGERRLAFYDDANRMIRRVDPAGNATLFAYDAVGNLVSVTEPLGGETRYEYDADNRRIAIIDALGNKTRMVYDSLGRMIAVIYPNGTRKEWVYDGAGRPVSITDPDGDVTQLSYDLKGRLIGRSYSDGRSESYQYDGADQLISATGDEGTITLRYNGEGLLSRMENPDGSRIEYGYDVVGAVTSVSTRIAPSAPPRTTTYAYDEFGRLIRVTDPEGGETEYEWDAMSNLVATTYPNGVQSSYTYDDRDRLTRVSHARGGVSLETFDYSYDAMGNRTRVDLADGASVTYGFDAQNRLIRESHFDTNDVKQFELLYEYDAAGNRVRTVSLDGQETRYVYNSANQLTSRGDSTFSYGPDGNLAGRQDSSGATLYNYDARNLLAGVTSPTHAVDFTYNAMGDLIQRSVDGDVENYIVSVAPPGQPSRVLAEYEDGGAVIAENVFGNRMISRRQDGESFAMHGDASLNVRLLTDETGTATDRYDYDAFGNLIGRSGTTPNPYRFAGERYGEEEGLSYLRARYYDPRTGRLTSRDPFSGFPEKPLSQNPYQYGYQNPLSFSDPSGQVGVVSVLASIAIVSVIAGIGVNYLFDVKSDAGELRGLTEEFRAQFCAGVVGGEGFAVGEQDVLIAENELGLRPQGPTSASYQVVAFGAGFGLGTLGSDAASFGVEFPAPGKRNVTQFTGTGKFGNAGFNSRLVNASTEIHYLPEGSEIAFPPSAGLGPSKGSGSWGSIYLTTFWYLQGKNDALDGETGQFDCPPGVI